MSTFTNKTILLTGSNRGIGKALLIELLTHNPKKIYATARDTSKIEEESELIEKVTLDLKDSESVANLAQLKDVDILINNAGVFDFAAPAPGEENMAVNYYGTVNVTETVLPQINDGGGVMTISSIIGLAPMQQVASYSASKAAIHSYVQAKRQQLKGKDIFIAGVYPGAIETDMTKNMEIAKADVKETANSILAGYESRQEYIFPDPMSQPLGEAYLKDVPTLEKSLNS